jgi:adenine phosphoribosyltransferase
MTDRGGSTTNTPVREGPDSAADPDAPHATYRVDIGGLSRDLPLCEVAPGVSIAVFNMLGDVEVTEAAARALCERLPTEVDVIVTAEAKSIPLAYAMARISGLPHVILRKTWKPYMGDALRATTKSITTGKEQDLVLDAKDRPLLHGARAAIVDDVISTGSTLAGMRDILTRAGAGIAAEMAVFTEGDAERWRHVIALGHLPVFEGEAGHGSPPSR